MTKHLRTNKWSRVREAASSTLARCLASAKWSLMKWLTRKKHHIFTKDKGTKHNEKTYVVSAKDFGGRYNLQYDHSGAIENRLERTTVSYNENKLHQLLQGLYPQKRKYCTIYISNIHTVTCLIPFVNFTLPQHYNWPYEGQQSCPWCDLQFNILLFSLWCYNVIIVIFCKNYLTSLLRR